MLAYNNAPLPECEGFTPLQMRDITYFPFDEDSPVKLLRPDTELLIQESPVLKIILELLSKLNADKGKIKLTQTGNLPPGIVKEIYAKGYYPDRWIDNGIVKIRTETNWIIIHNARLVLTLAGLTRKSNNWLLLTKKYETLLKNNNIHEIFLAFFEAFTTKFRWAYNDGYDDDNLGQIGFLYSLFLLNKYGNTERDVKFYADKYFLAYPSFVEFSSEEDSRQEAAFNTRFINRFALWFGFAEENIIEGRKFSDRVIKIKSTKLLRNFL